MSSSNTQDKPAALAVVNCVVCSSLKPKYKCSQCKQPFCSAKCGKTHRQSNDCQQQPTAPSTSEEGPQGNVEPVGNPKRPREEVEDNAENGDESTIQGVFDEDGSIQILGERQLNAIRHDKKVRDMLRTKELRAMIKIIDKSRSRLDALEAGLHNSTEFNHFCDHLLGVIYGSCE